MAASALRWKGRNHFNFVAGVTKLRVVPVVLHLLPEDIEWFSKDPSLFDELKCLLRDRVIASANNGEKDAEAPKTRKRARKEELCIQGERLQFTYRYRKTLPRYTVLSYVNNEDRTDAAIARNTERLSANNEGNRPALRHYPLSESSLLVWVYQFDSDDRYKPVPNEAGLQFAPTPVAKHQPFPSSAASGRALDLEDPKAAEEVTTGVLSLGGPRDTGLLQWLWGWDKGEGANEDGGGGGGGVRQHFLGSAAWQGRPEAAVKPSRRRQEEDDLQLAITLSLKESGSKEKTIGTAMAGKVQDLVEVVDDDNDSGRGGMEESKGAR